MIKFSNILQDAANYCSKYTGIFFFSGGDAGEFLCSGEVLQWCNGAGGGTEIPHDPPSHHKGPIRVWHHFFPQRSDFPARGENWGMWVHFIIKHNASTESLSPSDPESTT